MAALYSPDDALRHGIEAAAKRTDEGKIKILRRVIYFEVMI